MHNFSYTYNKYNATFMYIFPWFNRLRHLSETALCLGQRSTLRYLPQELGYWASNLHQPEQVDCPDHFIIDACLLHCFVLADVLLCLPQKKHNCAHCLNSSYCRVFFSIFRQSKPYHSIPICSYLQNQAPKQSFPKQHPWLHPLPRCHSDSIMFLFGGSSHLVSG